jgi:hypothetical protein
MLVVVQMKVTMKVEIAAPVRLGVKKRDTVTVLMKVTAKL